MTAIIKGRPPNSRHIPARLPHPEIPDDSTPDWYHWMPRRPEKATTTTTTTTRLPAALLKNHYNPHEPAAPLTQKKVEAVTSTTAAKDKKPRPALFDPSFRRLMQKYADMKEDSSDDKSSSSSVERYDGEEDHYGTMMMMLRNTDVPLSLRNGSMSDLASEESDEHGLDVESEDGVEWMRREGERPLWIRCGVWTFWIGLVVFFLFGPHWNEKSWGG